MNGEKDLARLLQTMQPEHNAGEFVFCLLPGKTKIDWKDIILSFKEKEGLTIVLEKQLADALHLEYSVVMSWITLTVHSSLEAVGLTAAFSKALAENGISCNVVAAFYHDHIFVAKKDTEKAMETLRQLSTVRPSAG